MSKTAKVFQGARSFHFDLNARRFYRVCKVESAGKMHPTVTSMGDVFRGDAWPHVKPYNDKADPDVQEFRANCEIRRIRCVPGKHQPRE